MGPPTFTCVDIKKVQSLVEMIVVAGQVEVPVGQVNFRGSLPRSANNVLQPMLHPARAWAQI